MNPEIRISKLGESLVAPQTKIQFLFKTSALSCSVPNLRILEFGLEGTSKPPRAGTSPSVPGPVQHFQGFLWEWNHSPVPRSLGLNQEIKKEIKKEIN